MTAYPGRGLTQDDLTDGMLQVLGTDGKVIMYNVPLVKTNGVSLRSIL